MYLRSVKLFLYISIFNLINNNVNCMSTYPCNIQDSVVLEESQKLSNGSYIYDNTLIPEHLVYESKSITYGCICLIKNCVSWCCSNKYQSLSNNICNDELVERIDDIDDDITTLTSEKIQSKKKFFEYFHIQTNKKLQCSKTYALNHIENDYDEWHIFDNGTIYQPIYEDDVEFAYTHKDIYCFALNLHKDENNSKFIVSPHFCQYEPSSHFSIYGISLLVAQPFIIITILLLLIKSKEYTIHTFTLIGYLSSISVSYICLAYIMLGTNHEENFKLCTYIGYIAYFAILSTYYWLSALGCDLYYNFNAYYNCIKIDNSIRNKVLLKYSGIVYTISIIYTILAYLTQNSNMSNSIKPGFGHIYCYLNVASGYSALIWLYLPLIIVVTYNSVMFVLLWRKFNIAELLIKRNPEINRNKFITLLYLFIVMGILWIFEIISYFVGADYINYFYITDIHNILIGFLIFLFVISRKQPEIPY